jgi:hypothetical protein
MDYFEHYNQLNMHTKSQLSNDWKRDMCINYKLGNLSYDEKSLTHTVIIKKNLQLTFQFQPDEGQFHITFYLGRFFKNKIYAFHLKLSDKDLALLKHITVVHNKSSSDLDPLSKYVTKIVDNCPFIYAQKPELQYLSETNVTVFYGFERTAVDFSINNDRDTQVFRCYMSEDRKFNSSHVYHLYCNQLRQIYENTGFELIDAHMKIKQKLVKTPYFLSKRINHDDWFLIADFSNIGTGFIANNNGEYIYILKHNEYSHVVKGTDKEFSLKDLLSKYSLDYFTFNKKFNEEKIDKLFSEFGLDSNNLTEKDFEAYSMYAY